MLTTTAGLPIARPPIEDRVLFVDTHCLDTTTVVSYEAENVTVLFLQSVCRVTNLSSPLIPAQLDQYSVNWLNIILRHSLLPVIQAHSDRPHGPWGKKKIFIGFLHLTFRFV